MNLPLTTFRRFANSRGAIALGTAVGIAAGIAAGWFSHGAYASAHDSQAPKCRDEVASIDNARGAVSCSSNDMTSEVKDGYLVCKCKKK
jgi:hypothetical protein